MHKSVNFVFTFLFIFRLNFFLRLLYKNNDDNETVYILFEFAKMREDACY